MSEEGNIGAVIFEFDGSLGMREFDIDDAKSTMEKLVREGYEVIVKTESEKKLRMYFGKDYLEQWKGRRTIREPSIRLFTTRYPSETASEKFYDDVLRKLGGMKPSEILIVTNDRNLLLGGKRRGFDIAHYFVGRYGDVHSASYSTQKIAYILQYLGVEKRASIELEQL